MLPGLLQSPVPKMLISHVSEVTILFNLLLNLLIFSDRAVIESRLRNMWTKISEDMTALAEERREDTVRKELMRWMGKVPAVLQNIVPKELVSSIHEVDLISESGKIGLQGVPRQTAESQPGAQKDNSPFRNFYLREISPRSNLYWHFATVYGLIDAPAPLIGSVVV